MKAYCTPHISTFLAYVEFSMVDLVFDLTRQLQRHVLVNVKSEKLYTRRQGQKKTKMITISKDKALTMVVIVMITEM